MLSCWEDALLGLCLTQMKCDFDDAILEWFVSEMMSNRACRITRDLQVRVVRLVADMSAHASGAIQVGDVLLAIDEYSVRHLIVDKILIICWRYRCFPFIYPAFPSNPQAPTTPITRNVTPAQFTHDLHFVYNPSFCSCLTIKANTFTPIPFPSSKVQRHDDLERVRGAMLGQWGTFVTLQVSADHPLLHSAHTHSSFPFLSKFQLPPNTFRFHVVCFSLLSTLKLHCSILLSLSVPNILLYVLSPQEIHKTMGYMQCDLNSAFESTTKGIRSSLLCPYCPTLIFLASPSI